LKAPAQLNTAPQRNKEQRSNVIKMGGKKRGERALYKNIIRAVTKYKEEGKRKSWGVYIHVRTVSHVRYFPDLPGGEITIEVISFFKHVAHVYHFPDLPFGEITIEGTSTFKHCNK